MNRDDAMRAFSDLHRESPETILRNPSDLNDEEGYVVEIRTDVSKLSELADLLEKIRRHHMTNKLTYDGEIELRTIGEDMSLWIVLNERLPDLGS